MDGPLAAEKLITAILAEIAALPDYDETLTALMENEIERLRRDQNSRKSQLEQMRDKTDRELDNIRASLRQAGPSTILIEELKDLESRRNEIHSELADLDRAPSRCSPWRRSRRSRTKPCMLSHRWLERPLSSAA